MGFLSGEITVNNRTSYNWTFCVETKNPWLFTDTYTTFKVEPYKSIEQYQFILTKLGKTIYLKVKYGQHSEAECCESPDLWYVFDPRDDPSFEIRESGDHCNIHLDCNIQYENKKTTCPNYGKLEDDARQLEDNRQQEDEERRRQAQRELERRIEEQIKRDSEIAAQKLSRATENLKQKQALRGQEMHHQTQLTQQSLEIYEIDKDEVADIERKFIQLLADFEITEDEDSGETVDVRMKTLQNEIMVEYCRKHDLSTSCLFSFDTAVGYETLSLQDRLSVLEAVLHLFFDETRDNHTLKSNRDFLFAVLQRLQDDHPSIALKLLHNVLYSDMQLSKQSKEILGQLMFSGTWTPAEISLFMQKYSVKDKEQVYSMLHMAQTYKLEFSLVISAMESLDPLRWLQNHVDQEQHKDVNAIISEMRRNNYPENILSILEEVLLYLEPMLQIYKEDELTENQIQDIKKMVEELDFSNPDRHALKHVLLAMAVGVKRSSAVKIQGGTRQVVIEGYLPRLTQLATLVVFLLSKSRTNTGCLLEIGTGEGKSCILAMLATIHTIRGVNVDVVTSSPVLAWRDLEEWRGLYKMFGITSSVVPPPLNDAQPEKQDELIQEAYKQQVVYSTVETLAADTLKQEFEKKTTRGERGFEMVLVDEVDYMTLDNGVQITFLAHESSGLQHLEQVLASIWAKVSSCQPIQMAETEEIMWVTRVQNFHMAALVAMMGFSTNDSFSPHHTLLPGIELGFYSESDFTRLNESISAAGEGHQDANDALKAIMAKTGVEQQYDLLTVLEMGMEHKVAFNCYVYQSETKKATKFGEQKAKTDQNIDMLLLENGKACEILSEDVLVESTVREVKSKITYSNQGSINDQTSSLVIPSFLEQYLENRLPVFVKNALRAIQMTKGREYMIELSITTQGMDISEDDQYMYHSIIPVDFQASGMLEKRKRWGDGLQQFLEMKHQLAISRLTNVTNYMSNFNLFKRYLNGRGVYGVSGTLGGESDKSFLARHYNTRSFVIPAHQRKKVIELPAVQVRGGTDKWIQKLFETVSQVSARGQVVLVVCEDVNTANALNEQISADASRPVTMYTMSESHNIDNQEFKEGHVIITTNLGGRGTDIKVTKKVNQRGGLFVILTYFPNNRRVEKQVFGRTGRKGTPGMVQMILNQDHLPMAYQGHSIEIMRELREENERKRIEDMEKEKLAETEMKEELFFKFCQFLSDFEKHYGTEEKTDLFEVRVKNVPHYFASFHQKMDYYPALNALKESWGMWLILHTDQINTQNDISVLKDNLIRHLQDTSDKLLQGQSANFYDHVQQALGRTALHFQKKNKCDYGALSYWDRASSSDNHYRAVALYNKAYITINMADKDYKDKARCLLQEAEKALGVYVSETGNTLSFCFMSVSREPHLKGCCNLPTQMQARMNIFSSWKQNISKILDMLQSSKDDFGTVDLTLYDLLASQDFVSTTELELFRNYGLLVVFEVRQKPKFCHDALICCFIGVVQVVSGVLLCAWSEGSLNCTCIDEGVSDIILGITGMINGNFDWASWAMQKGQRIAFSLVCGGFKTSSNALQPPMSNYALVRSMASTISIRNLSSSMGKLNLKYATKYAVHKLAVEGVNIAVNKIPQSLQNKFKQGFRLTFKNSVYTALQENEEFVRALTDFISSGISKAALERKSGHYKIGKNLEKQMRDHVDSRGADIITDLIVSSKIVNQNVKHLSELYDKLAQDLKFNPGINTNTLVKMLSTVPTKNTIDTKFVPAFLKSLKEDPLFETYDNDGRDKLEDVKRLKNDIVDLLAEGLSRIMVESFSGHAPSIFTKTFTQKLNSVTGRIVSNLLGEQETKSFFANQQHRYDLKSAKKCKVSSLSKAELKTLQHYAQKLTDNQQPTTALDVHVLTKSDLLRGKGICVNVVDDKGNLLTEETYPGTDPTAGSINLLLTKVDLPSPGNDGNLAKLKRWMLGEDLLHDGHIDILHPDGSREAVKTNPKCLFHAIVEATTNNPDDVQQKALKLRKSVGEEILLKPGKYADAVKIQNMFNETNVINKFKIQAGLSQWEELRAIYIKDKTPKQIINDYKLGEVGEPQSLLGIPGLVEAGHIPPKKTWTDVYNLIKTNPETASSLKEKNQEAYWFVMSTINDQERNKQLCMNTLSLDHGRALTSGNSAESRACRDWLTNLFASGDTEKALKFSLMMAHPGCSDNVWNDLGFQNRSKTCDSGLKETERNQYYKTGFRQIVKTYSKWNLIDQSQAIRLLKWVKNDTFLETSSPEYEEIITTLKTVNKKR
ncbi:uncharacterized protein LOC134312545 [Trichomycterus rosablanca]|uniref:uncharacterized protein LOC134312545 n=1 Tax=Trichomycterus rosablanca TaxID=2290929 RepID=UPI002F355A44